jgi:SAM-dependent methyltransferase
MTHETRKCHVRRFVQGHLQKMTGHGLDIGGGNDPLRPLDGACRVWDRKQGDGDARYLSGVAEESLDYVYSSHCLEHLPDPIGALKRWIEVVKPAGYLYVVVPDYDLYEGGKGIRNRFHRSAFSLARQSDPEIPLYNTLDLIRSELRGLVRLLYLALCDDHFDYGRSDCADQTRLGAVCHIEVLVQKVVS